MSARVASERKATDVASRFAPAEVPSRHHATPGRDYRLSHLCLSGSVDPDGGVQARHRDLPRTAEAIPVGRRFHGIWTHSRAMAIWTFLANSFLYSTGAVVISLAFALFASYGLSRSDFKGKQTTLVLILVVQMIPALVTAIPIYLLMQRIGLYNSRIGMVILYSSMRIPWGVWIMVGFLNQIPRALDEA